MRVLTRYIVCALGCACLVWAGEVEGAREQPGKFTRSFYWAFGKKRPLKIALDHIGVLVRRGVDSVAVSDIADTLGMGSVSRIGNKPSWQRGEFLYSVALLHPVSRDSVVRLARAVKRAGGPAIAEAGMLVTVEGSQSPVIVTDKFCVQFRPGTLPGTIADIDSAQRVRALEADALAPNHYLLEVTDSTNGDAITVAARYQSLGANVRYAHPNWIHNIWFRGYTPSDQYFDKQWHHENTGREAGTPDADIDTPAAWEITRRVSTTSGPIIAVIDGGFDLQHPDLAGNLCGTLSGAQCRDYLDCDGLAGEDCDDPDPSWEKDSPFDHDCHGTPVAGLVGAAWDNVNAAGTAQGMVGSCPTAQLLLIRRGFDEQHLARAFRYAAEKGATIITNSWGYYNEASDPGTETLHETIESVVSAGVTVLFAMDYSASTTDCERTGDQDLASISDVIAMGASTNWDRRLRESACGDYLDVLAPANRGYGLSGYPYTGSLDIATADIMSSPGYNSEDAWRIYGCPEPTTSPTPDYSLCFGGTSAATPIAAGVVGLLKMVRSGTTPTEIRRVLQDTADRIEDSEAKYGDETGFSAPSSTKSTHGYGRINAFEATRLLASAAVGGKGGTDVFIRDNRLDWGNTEQPSNTLFDAADPASPSVRGFIGQWSSPDIKLKERSGGPGTACATMSSKDFEAVRDEDPIPGKNYVVYVRVRNRGPVAAANVKVKLFWTYSGSALPALPSDLWSNFTSATYAASEWRYLGECSAGSLAYCGATTSRESHMAGSSSTDNAIVFQVPFSTPADDPALPNNYCLLAIVDSDTDHPLARDKALSGSGTESDLWPDVLVPMDNNVAYKETHVTKVAGSGGKFPERFLLRNPTSTTVTVTYSTGTLPSGWSVTFTGDQPGVPVSIDAGKSKLVTMNVDTGSPSARGDVSLTQSWINPLDPRQTVIGGLVFRYTQ